MIGIAVVTADEERHRLSWTGEYTALFRWFPEQIAAFEERFGSPVEEIYVDGRDIPVWHRATEEALSRLGLDGAPSSRRGR